MSGAGGRFNGEVIVNDNFSASGMKPAVVASGGVQRRLCCMASTESWLEYFCEGGIHDDTTTVKTDPDFTTVVDFGRTYSVFLTPLGDC
jgi:hypothetical protein